MLQQLVLLELMLLLQGSYGCGKEAAARMSLPQVLLLQWYFLLYSPLQRLLRQRG